MRSFLKKKWINQKKNVVFGRVSESRHSPIGCRGHSIVLYHRNDLFPFPPTPKIEFAKFEFEDSRIEISRNHPNWSPGDEENQATTMGSIYRGEHHCFARKAKQDFRKSYQETIYREETILASTQRFCLGNAKNLSWIPTQNLPQIIKDIQQINPYAVNAVACLCSSLTSERSPIPQLYVQPAFLGKEVAQVAPE